jgi:hypothetical protein
MFRFTGRSHAISPFRRLVNDLMHFSRKVPSVTIERRLNLSAVVSARLACAARPCWSAIFIKGFALVTRRYPEFRLSYMSFPWPRLYEHPHHIATLNIEREVDGEKMVVCAQVPSPDQCSLLEIHRLVRSYRERPVEEIPSHVRARRLSRVPWPLRRWLWWAGLNVLGGHRCEYFGTFGTTTVAAHGAGVFQIIPLLTSTLYYGLLDEAGCLDMRLAFDHRVLDGVTAARALLDLEEILHEEILRELRDLVDGPDSRERPACRRAAPVTRLQG